MHTSLGEESAEALIGILSLALLGEVAIGLSGQVSTGDVAMSTKEVVDVVYLDTVLEAVELQKTQESAINDTRSFSGA